MIPNQKVERWGQHAAPPLPVPESPQARPSVGFFLIPLPHLGARALAFRPRIPMRPSLALMACCHKMAQAYPLWGTTLVRPALPRDDIKVIHMIFQ